MHTSAAILEVNASLKSATRKRRGTRFPGIQQDAADLGIHRTQLWFVLTGQRPGADMIASYTHLLTTQGRHIPTNLGKAA